jgi:TonB family protein
MTTKRILISLLTILMSVLDLHAQQPNASFAAFDRAVKAERGGFAGNKSHLSAVFDAERRRLGDRFESELLKWLENDPEKHDWISIFLEEKSYLHGNRRLPYLSLLVKQQGLALVHAKDDEESQRYAVRLSITGAILSSELGFEALASSYKSEAEGLLLRQPNLKTSIPGSSDADRQRYDEIKSSVSRPVPTIVADNNPPPKATISGGILNGRAIKQPKPSYPSTAREQGASGTVEVRVVLDETGRVIWARAISGHPLLRHAAEEAAWQTEFPVTKLSGQPVKVSGVLLYNFVP